MNGPLGLVNERVGHTPDDQSVWVTQLLSFWQNGVVLTSIEHGRQVLSLDHLDPELIPALRRSLTPIPVRSTA